MAGSPVKVEGTLVQLGGAGVVLRLSAGAASTSLSPMTLDGSSVDVDIIGAPEARPAVLRNRLATAIVNRRPLG